MRSLGVLSNPLYSWQTFTSNEANAKKKEAKTK